MNTSTQAHWPSIQRISRIYAVVSFIGIALGVIAAHLPPTIGIPWTSCSHSSSPLTCVLVFHLYEVPIVVFLIYVAWYAFRRLTPVTLDQFRSLVVIGIGANVAFFTFEMTLIMDGLHREAAAWETFAICGVASLLVGGAGFGVYVQHRLQTLSRKSVS